MKNTLFIISAPSGAGKTSLVNALTKEDPELQVSVSVTTRSKRPAEKAGRNYIFASEKKFNDLIQQNVFLEHAVVFGFQYGTSREWVENTLKSGKDVILEIDWQGALQIQQKMPESVSIYILPPSIGILRKRLEDRAQDTPEVIEKRLGEARTEISHSKEYNYLILNDVFEEALQDLQTIIKATRLSMPVQQYRFKSLLEKLLTEK